MAFRENSEIFKRLAEVANVATLTPEERYHYEADVKNARDTINQIRVAFQEGEEKGRAEERLESIRFMLSLDIPVETIARKYGMTSEEVIKLA